MASRLAFAGNFRYFQGMDSTYFLIAIGGLLSSGMLLLGLVGLIGRDAHSASEVGRAVAQDSQSNSNWLG